MARNAAIIWGKQIILVPRISKSWNDLGIPEFVLNELRFRTVSCEERGLQKNKFRRTEDFSS